MTDGLRAEAMKRRLARTAARRGVAEDGMALVMAAFDLGMGPRLAAALDDHHPDYLHPSRTALILMDDAHVSDARVIAAALVVETRAAALRVLPAALDRLDPHVAMIVAEIPAAGGGTDALAERLVTASSGARMVAIAERLDHARHLHLRDRAEWEGYHATTCRTYAPVAERTNDALAGRIAWWCGTFRERFLADR